MALALASAVNAQILNDILDGTYIPSKSSELSTPLLLTLSPQNGTPYEVLTLRLENVSPDIKVGDEFYPGDDQVVVLYSEQSGDETLYLPLYEKGVYTIFCLDENGNNVGEQVSIFVNERFLQGLIDQGYAEKSNGLITSTKPLRIGREDPEFVSFN